MIYVVVNKSNNYNDINQSNNIYFQYAIENNILKILIHIDYPKEANLPSNEFTIPIDINQYCGQYIVIKLLRDYISVKNNKGFSTFAKFISPLIDFNYSNLYSNGYEILDIGSKRFLSLYITKDKKDIYIHPLIDSSFNKEYQDNCQYIEKEMVDSNHLAMLTSSCKELKEYIEKWNIKKNILDPNIDISKSATYLETEIDTLYKIMGILLNKIKIDVSEYQPIIDAVERHNVLNTKNLNKLVSEIDEDKENIRKRQKIYYDKAYQQ